MFRRCPLINETHQRRSADNSSVQTMLSLSRHCVSPFQRCKLDVFFIAACQISDDFLSTGASNEMDRAYATIKNSFLCALPDEYPHLNPLPKHALLYPVLALLTVHV